MAIPLSDYFKRHLESITPDSGDPPFKAVMGAAPKPDWSAVILDMASVSHLGPRDFEQEYLCTPEPVSVPTPPFVTSAATTASTSSTPLPSASEMLKVMETFIGSGRMNEIVEESIREVETGQERAAKVEPARAHHPEFGSW